MYEKTNRFNDGLWQGTWLMLPLFPQYNEKHILSLNLFENMRQNGKTFSDLKIFEDKFTDVRRSFCGVMSNSTAYLLRGKTKFRFLMGDKQFALWTDDDRSLGFFTIDPHDVPSKDFIDWILKTTEEFINGIIHCSSCGKEINVSEIAGNYFAGVYCQKCWDTKYKELEANESYD